MSGIDDLRAAIEEALSAGGTALRVAALDATQPGEASATCAVCDGQVDFSQSGKSMVVGWCATCIESESKDRYAAALADATVAIKALPTRAREDWDQKQLLQGGFWMQRKEDRFTVDLADVLDVVARLGKADA